MKSKRFKKLLKDSNKKKSNSINIGRIILISSSLANLGIFLVALFGFFYTVVPLYKISSLEESIYVKQKELDDINDKFKEIYSRYRYFVVQDFYLKALPMCSPLFEKQKIENFTLRKEFEVNFLFKTNYEECFLGVINKIDAYNNLSIEDKDILMNKIISNSFDLRSKINVIHESYIKNNSHDYRIDIFDLPKESYRAQWLEEMESLDVFLNKPFNLERRKEVAIKIENDRIITNAQSAVTRSLKDIKNLDFK